MNEPLTSAYYELLEEIQAVDFVLCELTLYLDTHPWDNEAIQQFNHHAHQSRQLKKQYEKQYGPLFQYGMSYSGYPWNWKEAPWPWQV